MSWYSLSHSETPRLYESSTSRLSCFNARTNLAQHYSKLYSTTPACCHHRWRTRIRSHRGSGLQNHNRCKACKLLYLVRWACYEGTDEETSWILTTKVDNVSELIQDFHKSYPTKPGPLAIL